MLHRGAKAFSGPNAPLRILDSPRISLGRYGSTAPPETAERRLAVDPNRPPVLVKKDGVRIPLQPKQ